MKLSKKTFILASCLILVISTSVFGSIAYLVSEKTITNTFTIGDVGITLNETKVDENGEAVTDPATGQPVRTADEEGNAYKLIPGKTYTKDPMITVTAGSEESFIRMKVTINKVSELRTALSLGPSDPILLQNFVGGWDGTKWITTGVIAEDLTANTATYEFRYYQTVAAAENTPLEPLFETFTVPSGFDKADLEALMTTPAFEIEVISQAIQALGFADDAAAGKTAADLAWEAFDTQISE